jgi:predicted amidohydrolase
LAEVIRYDFPGDGHVATQRPVASVAALNLSPEPGDPEGNLLLAERAIAGAKRECPSLRWVVLPELFTCGYSGLESVHRYAEDAQRGESVRFLRTLARELGVFIAYGFPERAPGSATVFDSANLVGPEGVLATYRKRNLVRTTPEHYVFGAGTWLPVVEAGGVRVSLVVCWDLGFPEVAREAAMGGADLILAPAAWREPWGPQYELSCAARALDSGVFVASANQLGDYGEALFATPGYVYGPDGLRVSRSTGAGNTCDLDPTAPGRWRGLYGNTFIDDFEAAIVDEEPLEACS